MVDAWAAGRFIDALDLGEEHEQVLIHLGEVFLIGELVRNEAFLRRQTKAHTAGEKILFNVVHSTENSERGKIGGRCI